MCNNNGCGFPTTEDYFQELEDLRAPTSTTFKKVNMTTKVCNSAPTFATDYALNTEAERVYLSERVEAVDINDYVPQLPSNKNIVNSLKKSKALLLKDIKQERKLFKERLSLEKQVAKLEQDLISLRSLNGCKFA